MIITVLSVLCFCHISRCQKIDAAVELVEESRSDFSLNGNHDNHHRNKYSTLQFLESIGDSTSSIGFNKKQEPEYLPQYAKPVQSFPSFSSHSFPTPLTHKHCYEKYSHRTFLPITKQSTNRPTMLYTFPGVGNHWIQLLIEYATGFYTGSVYKERLTMLLPGATHCDASVSMIKIHMHHFHFNHIHKGNFTKKCDKGGIIRFERAVLLIRDPFDSIWSEYQRRATANARSRNAHDSSNNPKSGNNHVGMIELQYFNTHDWYNVAMELSKKYVDMHNAHYDALLNTYDIIHDVLLIKFENFLKHRDNHQQKQTSTNDGHHMTTHIHELRKLAQFLHLPTTEERLACAFSLAESSKTHRTSNSFSSHTLQQSSEADMTTSSDASAISHFVTKADAYGINNKQLVCKMWKLFGEYAQAYNYSIWNHTDCSY